MKDKEYKDYWESDIGCSFIPNWILNEQIDLDALEEGGVIDEETLPAYLKGRPDTRVVWKMTTKFFFLEARRLKQMAKKEESNTPTATPLIQLPFVALPASSNASTIPSIPMPIQPGPSARKFRFHVWIFFCFLFCCKSISIVTIWWPTTTTI